MKNYLEEISVATTKGIEFIDVTDKVRQIVSRSGIKNGLASVFSNHTTAGVRINERCRRLQKDMESMLREMAPSDKAYRHNETAVDKRGNAHSHLMSLITGISETVPVSKGEMILGTWQAIFFMEFDGPRKSRSITVTVVGE
jgi:secondary thiamine-phosphate synthase enzyme